MPRWVVRGASAVFVLAAAARIQPLNAATHTQGLATLSPRLESFLAQAPVDTPVMAWVFFADKGPAVQAKGALRPGLVSERSLRRRAKVLPPDAQVDSRDLPVLEAAVGEVALRVVQIRQRSKWFNGVSVLATPEQIHALQFLPRVRAIELVGRYRRNASEDNITPDAASVQAPRGTPHVNALDYGPSLTQLQQMNVPALHDQDINGQGVLIAHFDNGYRLLAHEALASLQIVAAYDFVDHDPDPAPPANAPTNFGAHGIQTLSVLGGFKPGELIGTAYGAQYVLARTEDDGSETPFEEDNWVAAIEWADSLGVDVASTSLGYLDFDAPYFSYSWFDLDGDTPIITRAADLAAQRGIVVLNSAGNSGSDIHNTLLAPADGDSVIAVGAVTAAGDRSTFSSVGPTTDFPPRIKPDIMAMGSSVHVARTVNTVTYGTSSGTSFSCPLAAGVAALLLSAHPTATPMQIRDALRSTASMAATPGNLYGWGIIDAVAALNFLTTSDVAPPPARSEAAHLEANMPNPFNPSTSIAYWLPADAAVALRIHDARGRAVRTLVAATQTRGRHVMQWNGDDDLGRRVAGGVYVCSLEAARTAGTTPARIDSDRRKLVLLK
jgi:subtilisin family serine protease